MNTIKKITSFTAHQTAEGMRLSATYSEISENGTINKSNERFNIVVVDDEISKSIFKINEFLTDKTPS